MKERDKFALELASEIDITHGLPAETTLVQLQGTIVAFIQRYWPGIDFDFNN